MYESTLVHIWSLHPCKIKYRKTVFASGGGNTTTIVNTFYVLYVIKIICLWKRKYLVRRWAHIYVRLNITKTVVGCGGSGNTATIANTMFYNIKYLSMLRRWGSNLCEIKYKNCCCCSGGGGVEIHETFANSNSFVICNITYSESASR